MPETGPFNQSTHCRVTQKTGRPFASIAFSASRKNGVDFAVSSPTWATYSSQLFMISSRNSVRSVPAARHSSRRFGW
jgi:hypothetical protein